ncbi:MAG: hypothetical protein ACR2LN_05820 [Candidatus Levyibacteriota bacterium]
MTQRYWFKAHKSGYGWHPATWEGWMVLLFYIFFLVISFFQIDSQSHSASEMVWGFLPRFLLFSAILTVITYLKGESITWGEKDKDGPKIP